MRCQNHAIGIKPATYKPPVAIIHAGRSCHSWFDNCAIALRKVPLTPKPTITSAAIRRPQTSSRRVVELVGTYLPQQWKTNLPIVAEFSHNRQYWRWAGETILLEYLGTNRNPHHDGTSCAARHFVHCSPWDCLARWGDFFPGDGAILCATFSRLRPPGCL